MKLSRRGTPGAEAPVAEIDRIAYGLPMLGDFVPADVALRSWVNEESRQSSGTADRNFSCAEIVRDLSQHMQLDPGDVISTGTPEGVALSAQFPYLRAGDVVELEIDGLGHQPQMMRTEERR